MKIDRELERRARATTYHQRKALRRIGGDLDGVPPATLASLVNAGWVCIASGAPLLTSGGKEVHDALKALGWFPAEEKPKWPRPAPPDQSV